RGRQKSCGRSGSESSPSLRFLDQTVPEFRGKKQEAPMRTLPGRSLLLLLLLVPATAFADVSVRVPVVTQVQGVVLFRTSLTVANGSRSRSASIALQLSYRSPVDRTFQRATMAAGQLLPHRTLFFEDIVQDFKDDGAIRAQDQSAGIFASLRVPISGSGQRP